jgi:hypothetical protein
MTQAGTASRGGSSTLGRTNSRACRFTALTGRARDGFPSVILESPVSSSVQPARSPSWHYSALCIQRRAAESQPRSTAERGPGTPSTSACAERRRSARKWDADASQGKHGGLPPTTESGGSRSFLPRGVRRPERSPLGSGQHPSGCIRQERVGPRVDLDRGRYAITPFVFSDLDAPGRLLHGFRDFDLTAISPVDVKRTFPEPRCRPLKSCSRIPSDPLKLHIG